MPTHNPPTYLTNFTDRSGRQRQRPVVLAEPAVLTSGLSREIGRTGLAVSAGQVREEFLPELQGDRGRKVYAEMSANDPVVGAVLHAVEMALRAVKWHVEPASKSGTDKKAAEFLEDCMDSMSFTWNDTLSEILSFLTYGWAYTETVYQRRDDGYIGWRKFALRAQDTLDKWEFDTEGGVKGMWQSGYPDYKPVYIPIEKSLLFRTRVTKNNPEGVSILRRAFRPWYLKKNLEEVEAIGIERDLTGMPVLMGPENVDLFAQGNSTILTSAKDVVRNVRVDEQMGLVLNSGWDFKLVASSGSRQHDTNTIINRYDRRIAMSVLAQFVMLGMERVGSYALARSQTDLFILSLSGWADSICETINRYEVPRLFALNPFGVEELPKFAHSDVGGPNLTELADFLQKVTGQGLITPDEQLEDYLREQARLPELDRATMREKMQPTLPPAAEKQIAQKASMLSERQALRELGYSLDATERIAAERDEERRERESLGAYLLKDFDSGKE